jgi:protein-tyrosine phosphatase
MLFFPPHIQHAAEFTLPYKKLLWVVFSVVLLTFGAIQFVPAPALQVPAALPEAQRDAHRLLNFEGIANFRDLGGYHTEDGKQVKWGVLYRTGTLANSSNADLKGLEALKLKALIDFRSSIEKEQEPNRLPETPQFDIVEIPTLDEGNEAMVGEIMERIDSGDFHDFDPDQTMLNANRQFASTFTPQFSQFMHTVVKANGKPVVWHCSAGKDRTGFAAAILLRILGVPQEVVIRDYMESRQNALEARKLQLWLLRLFKGQEAADKLSILMGVEEAWLEAAFDEIDHTWGSFDSYVRDGLGVTDTDIALLRSKLLVSPDSTGV